VRSVIIFMVTKIAMFVFLAVKIGAFAIDII
jgi:hypothetical protein